ncbi:neutral alpha-glucosidase C isoform X2 [Micropterus dolomieu]|uniref:neutral alpha-glucosidase C isoform X2 n=1 Tax=Micropterus dolomieu TaxID=147949 RepID=UPI001E8CA0A4|nr:neutral alpha-glucosidase C isoform X2 [Micropterus dolomieu]
MLLRVYCSRKLPCISNYRFVCAFKVYSNSSSVVPEDEGREKFKKSEHVAFYRRQIQGPNLQHRALLDTMVLTEKGARLELLEPDSQTKLLLSLSLCKNDTVRILIDELEPVKARYRVPDVITGELQCQQLRVERQSKDSVTLSWSSGCHKICVWRFPFRLEILCEDDVMVTFNTKGKLWFETLQDPPRATSHLQEDHSSSLWKETFRQFVDVKANGPSSIGSDLCLHGFSHVYGLPEHADSLQLRDTRDGEPYRLYNLDVFAYALYSRLGLYGSVPLLVAHKPDRTLGVFWLNASETFVNVHYSQSQHQDDQTPPVKRRRMQPQTDVHWLSESGVIDCAVLLGPSPQQLFSQYAQLTGYQALPPLFALGYHQCRWNYNDEADVKAVDAGFDRHDIPYDVIWLDIEHTDGKRYFTWDSAFFPEPASLQRHLEKKKRKLVVISDPHIKIDPDWSLYCEARDGGHFVKNREGQIYQGSCWPGKSSYLDFSSPDTRAWYSRCFSLDKYKGSTPSLFVWNDMNEPSVFDGPEQTMPKDTVHYGGWEHRELHNLYGFYQHMATVEGLITRSGGSERPFVLSRSFFAGSQRLGAVWTGDNVASWEYLKISIPMLLSLSVAGIAFCGADVGGFVEDPEPELLVRWYQAAALQPFFRGHSANTTKRREPWLFGNEVTATIRTVIQQRYCLLPYWYTLFHKAHVSGLPPLRPLWVEFQREQSTFTVDNQYMIGGALLACPVTEAGVEEVKVLLPGSGEVWYDVQSAKVYKGGRTLSLPVTLDTVPVFQRGGSVVCRSAGCGSCTAKLQQLPLSITVALNSQGVADGELYLDDGHSFSYRDRKAFCLRRFNMLSGHLLCRPANEEGTFDCDTVVQSVTILGVKSKPSTVVVHVPGAKDSFAAFHYMETCCMLTVSNLNLRVAMDWEIQIGSSLRTESGSQKYQENKRNILICQ